MFHRNQDFVHNERLYVVQEVLREGNRSTTYRVSSSDCDYFMKQFQGPRPVERERFIHANLGKDCQYICPLEDTIEKDNMWCALYPHLTGTSLHKVDTPIQWQVYIPLMLRVCEGLKYIHEREIVHLDIKPSNIFIEGDADEPLLTQLEDGGGNPKIVDFELSLHLEEFSAMENQDAGGTAEFMSPEYILAPESTTGQADIYALGVTSYQLLTGVRPFAGTNTETTLTKVMFNEPVGIHRLSPEIDPRLVAVINCMMAKSINERYASVKEVLSALSEIESDISSDAG